MDEPRTDPDSADEPVGQMRPEDVASAGRSCSALLILLVAVVLVLCVGIALRWVLLG